MQINSNKIKKIREPHLRAPIIKELKSRFSPRFFNSERINNKNLRSIFEAARWAPSAYNDQPWYFYWANHGSNSYQKIKLCLSEKNKWAKTASAFIISCYIKKSKRGINKYAQYDLGQAVIAMIIQAQSMGIYARQMALFDKKKLQKILHIPLKYTPFVIVAMGKLGDYKKINDEELLARELNKRERKNNVATRI